MLANRILNILVSLTSPIVIPVQLVTTFVGGCVGGLTFGLALLPFNLIWMLLLGFLLGTSWLYCRLPPLRVPLALVGVPVALLSEVYISCMPSMGDLEARRTKLFLTWMWPYSLDWLGYTAGKSVDVQRLGELVRVARQAGIQVPEASTRPRF